MPVYDWSRTASSNGTADGTCPFPEGMAPSAYNDSARGLMAAVAQYRDDIAGAIVTTGTNASYLVSSFSGFDSTTHMDGQTIAFSPHVVNVDTVLLTVDGLGPFPLRASPGVELVGGTLILGTPYAALFNKTNSEFYLKGAGAGNPYNVPFLGGMDFWDTVAPNSRFIFPTGQAISRTVYSAAFARWGTTFGAGDGSTTFNVPNKAGRVSAMLDATGTILTTATMTNGDALGGIGGAQVHTLTLLELPPNIQSSGSVSVATSATSVLTGTIQSLNNGTGSGGVFQGIQNGTAAASQLGSTGSTTVQSTNTNGSPHINVQPTIVCNYIIRIL